MWGTIEEGGTEIEWHQGVPTLEEMQAHVGGLIQPVDLTDKTRAVTLYVHDEGKLIGLEPTAYVGSGPYRGEGLVGPIVVTMTDLATGDTVSVPEPVRERLQFDVHKSIKVGHGVFPIIEYNENGEG